MRAAVALRKDVGDGIRDDIFAKVQGQRRRARRMP